MLASGFESGQAKCVTNDAYRSSNVADASMKGSANVRYAIELLDESGNAV